MNARFTTRPLRLEDYDAVVSLWQRTEGIELSVGDERTGLSGFLQRNPGFSRVAEAEGGVVGAVLCGHDGRRGLIYHLAVAPEGRGRGIGRRLLEECTAALRAAGIKRAIILVAKDNALGRDFWLAQGFEDIDGANPMGLDL